MHESHRALAVGAALPWELAAIVSALRSCGESVVEPRPRMLWQGTVASCPVLVYRTGVGIRAARKATRRVVRAHDVGFVLNTGCAGALTAGWAAGDIVAAQAILSPPPACERMVIRAPIHQMIGELATAVGRTPRTGTILTSLLPLFTAAQKEEHGRAWGAHAVEMEGAGVARAAAEAACGFASVRTILDPLRSELPFLPLHGPPTTARKSWAKLSPRQAVRRAVLFRHQRFALASLRDFHEALFAALRGGTIDLDLLGLR